MSRLLCLSLAVIAVIAAIGAGPRVVRAAATPNPVQAAAAALASDSVYVDPDADPGLSPAEAEDLRRRIARSGAGAVRIAVLPPAAVREAGGADALLRDLVASTGRRGTYVVVSGTRLEAGSTEFRGVGNAAAATAREHRGEGVAAVLTALVDRIPEVRAGGGSRGTADGGGSGEDAGTGGLVLLGALAAGAGGLVLVSRRRRRRAEADEMEEVKENARDDLVALGEDIRALDIDRQLDSTPPAAKEAYDRAVLAYERAETAWERARTPEDLEPAGAALEEGRYAMASAKALAEGRTPPERRPPCFFDPRHGPSTRDVEWAPPYGEPRRVPACEADALRVEEGVEPAAREVLVGGSRVPYWNAGPAYAPFAGGYFGGFGGGLLPGLLVGSMLGGGLGMGLGAGAAYGAGGWDGGGWDGGGDFGGGDFGGGDFGGGDLGGGDFGGGDFGGGDFGGGDFGGGDF